MIDKSKCHQNCEGVSVSSYISSTIPEDLVGKVEQLAEEYKKYKSSYLFPNFIQDIEKKEILKIIKIKFDTPTSDRITKDKSAKFVDQLSAIGGTMGLLTGFSIISGVEILYFSVNILLSKLSKLHKICRIW